MSSFKKIDEKSAVACHSGLNIFSVPPTNLSILKSGFREILPLNSSNFDSPIEFRIFNDNQWIDPSNIYLYIVLILEKKDGVKFVPITDTETLVGSIQSPGQSIIQTLKIHMNGVEISNENLYPYMAHIKHMLSFSEDVRTDELVTQGYFKDTFNVNSSGNPGFINRVQLFEKGRKAELLSKLEFDLANQEQFLLNNMDIVFSIYKSDDAFLVHKLKTGDTNEYRFRIDKAKLFVKTIDVQPSVNLAVLKTLEKTSAKYPVRKTEMRSSYISVGHTEFVQNIFTNVVPRRLVIGLVDTKAYAGDPTLTPFNFEPFDIRSISIEACGLNYPSVKYDLNFTDDSNPDIVRAYLDMHKAVNLTRKNTSNGISFDKFKKSCTLFVIPLTSTLEDYPGYELVRNGTTTLKLTFNSPIKGNGVTLIAMGEFDQLISIDSNRIVVTDGSV